MFCTGSYIFTKKEYSMLQKTVLAVTALYTVISLKCTSGDDTELLRKEFTRNCIDIMRRNRYGRICCDHAYTAFLRSFKGIIPKDMENPRRRLFGQEGYYKHYFRATLLVRQIRNNALFWSTTSYLQRVLVDERLPIKCVESIYATKIVEHMQDSVEAWCSDASGAVYVNDNCGENDRAVGVFWEEASIAMAERVAGNFFFLTSDSYFGKSSFFRRYELKSLLMEESKSSAITVLNVIRHGSKYTCGTKKLTELEELTKDKLSYRCFDVYGWTDFPSIILINCLRRIIEAVSRGM